MDIKNIVKEFLWRKYLFEISLLYGKEYLENKTNLTWVKWGFDRKVQRMSQKDWIEAARLYRYYLHLIEEIDKNGNEHTKTNKETEDSGSSAE